MFTDEQLDLIRKVQNELAKMTEEERLTFASQIMHGFCEHCGRVDPDGTCQCWNDE